MFVVGNAYLRDGLVCCGPTCTWSEPRERALMSAINEFCPDWRQMAIHESSPAPRGVSPKLKHGARRYVSTQLFSGVALGTAMDGIRCEDLERLTFPDESFDLMITQDVLEHVFDIDAVFREAFRTLRSGGYFISTVPLLNGTNASVPSALRNADGTIKHLVDQPEYHGNPVSDDGSLVTWHHGYDLANRAQTAAGFVAFWLRETDKEKGILGQFREVLVCQKR